jgi:transposase
MDRDELAGLDTEALIYLIVRLYERVTELEARVGRPPKTPGNSSVPPSAWVQAE